MGTKALQATAVSVPAETIVLAQPARLSIKPAAASTRIGRLSGGVIVCSPLFANGFQPARIPFAMRAPRREQFLQKRRQLQ